MLAYEFSDYRLGEKGNNGWLCTIPILNVFGRLERRSREGKGKGEIRSEEKTELEPIMLSPNTTKSLVAVLKSCDTTERTDSIIYARTVKSMIGL